MTVVAGATVAVSGPATADPPRVPLVSGPALSGPLLSGPALSGPAARAAGVADALVAGRPASLRAGADDAFVRQPVHAFRDWQYVPYERTYRGLPVVGGDFVVVVDPTGRVSSTSVARDVGYGALDVHPKLTQTTAATVALGQLGVAGVVKGTRLVVDAILAAPGLEWESVVEGRGTDGPRVRTVDVDAATGAVVRVTDDVLTDIGHSALNGGTVNVPDALLNCPSGNCPDQHTWILAYPAGGGMSCDAPTVHRTDPEPLVWGNGDPTSAETACVDAMFAAGAENGMLTHWLGRSGLDGQGVNDGLPMFTDSSTVDNSYYIARSQVNQAEVGIGHHGNGVWLTSLDIVGHENGHGVDDTTPGGISGGGTREFIGDAFGVATEWYANEKAPDDTPDWVLGDTPVLGMPTSGKRFMYDPQENGTAVNCYSAGTPSLDSHDAAGVGDHWLYLLAEGSHPTDGQPNSPTCDQGSVAGLGLRSTMQILYNAMLMKTSNSSYLTYRSWTLTAAKNLFPTNCAVLNIVRAAWNSVGVPQQPGEPVCVPTVTGVSQAAAQGALSANGLTTGSVTQQASLSPAGTVISQTPAAGAYLTPGAAVSLVVSAGGVKVPNVLSWARASAVSTVQNAGLGVVTSNQMACINPGEVLNESPPGGVVVLPGSTVSLTIDSGTVKSCGIIK